MNKELYDNLQVLMAYHSNKMEGVDISFNFVVNLYNKVDVKECLEVINHFKSFDFINANFNNVLDENYIKEIHKILQKDIDDNAGNYKKEDNFIGGLETCSPKDVHNEMIELLDWYNDIECVDIKDIIEFHYRFERIHPFSDGNGRVGRLIALKECLKNNIIPFIILDEKKMFYYNGLKNYKRDKNYLIDTCLDGQDFVINLIKKLDK